VALKTYKFKYGTQNWHSHRPTAEVLRMNPEQTYYFDNTNVSKRKKGLRKSRVGENWLWSVYWKALVWAALNIPVLLPQRPLTI